MYVFVKKDKETERILTVELEGTYKNKTESDMLEAITKFNANHEDVYYQPIQVEGDYAEVIDFLMGGKRYKIAKRIEDVLDKIEEVSDSIMECENEISDLRFRIGEMKDAVSIIKEEQNGKL